jgi:hypothetical protein
MTILNVKRVLLGTMLALIASVSLALAVDSKVDDFTGGTNQNYFENYWYYYDDNGGTKAEDRPLKAPPDSIPSVVNVPYTYKPRHASGNLMDTFKLKDYQFSIKTEGTNNFASMPFTYGTKWKCTGYTASPFVGIGTELVPDGKYLDLTGATAVTFKLRSRVNDLTVNFRIETMDIIRDSSFAYFYKGVTTKAGTWKDFTVSLVPTTTNPTGDLAQPSWAKGDVQKTTFAQNMCAKLSWEVHGEVNETVKFDTLDVDEIVIKDYNFVSPSLWTKTATARPATGLFATFETAPQSETPLGTYWYAYNDHDIGGSSQVSLGATQDPETGLLMFDWTPNTGYGNTGTGAAVKIQLGPTVRKANAPGDTVNVQGFIGIGFNTYDSSTALYFNTTTGKTGTHGGTGNTNSIYFEYLADGDFQYLTVEVSDSNDVPDKYQPTRKDTRGSGIVWYRNVPITGTGVWKAVEIPFDSLITHSTWKGYVPIPLKKTALAKIQFKAQGAKDKGGSIQIDNVFFPGITFPGVPPISSVKNSASHVAQQSAFRAVYDNGKVRVNWSPISNFSNAKISLIDSKGTIVTSSRITSASVLSLNIAAEKIPAGLYFVQLNGANAAGNSITQRSAIRIIK